MSMIRVGKYDTRGKLIAETHVATLPAAHAFLDSLDSAGNVIAPAPAAKPAKSADATVPG